MMQSASKIGAFILESLISVEPRLIKTKRGFFMCFLK
ncbi:hypothetical protein ATW7_02942 [Alteromonadales bacterium TW-7]|nr:hypothetical protein ATW7_02942 [Alteromonadales bacterium TW-7]